MSTSIHGLTGGGQSARAEAGRFLRLCPDARVFPLGWRVEDKSGKAPHRAVRSWPGEASRSVGDWPGEVWESATGYGVVLPDAYLVVDVDGPNFPPAVAGGVGRG